jgi:hypothetical protein
MKTNKKGQMTQGKLAAVAITVATIVFVAILYFTLKSKGVNMLAYLKDLSRSIGIG